MLSSDDFHTTGNRLYRYWIGGSDFAVEGSWRWLETGTSIGPYTNWADGRPTNNGTFNCMMMEWVGDELKWVDVECNHRDVTYICETPYVFKLCLTVGCICYTLFRYSFLPFLILICLGFLCNFYLRRQR